MKIPIFEGYRATNISIAFLLASLTSALSAVSAIEVRAQLENKESVLYHFIDKVTPGDEVHWWAIIIPVFLTAFFSRHQKLNLSYYWG